MLRALPPAVAAGDIPVIRMLIALSALAAMGRVTVHRGPDDEGAFASGPARLAPTSTSGPGGMKHSTGEARRTSGSTNCESQSSAAAIAQVSQRYARVLELSPREVQEALQGARAALQSGTAAAAMPRTATSAGEAAAAGPA